MEDRAAGALLGVASGDALGATFEFKPPNRGKAQTLITGGGPFRWRPGQPTDDTDLTLAVVRAYVSNPNNVVAASASNFVAWYESGPRDIGGTTAASIGRLRSGVPPEQSGATHDRSAANGSLMRTVATGVARSEVGLRRRDSHHISAITHAEPRCTNSCIAYNDMVSALIEGATPTEATDASLGNPELLPTVAATIERAAVEEDMPWSGGGYVLTALAIAVWALHQHVPARDLIVAVANHGGDADTNGAIAGGLVGARDGVSALPRQWTDTLETADELRSAVEPLLSLRRA